MNDVHWARTNYLNRAKTNAMTVNKSNQVQTK